MAMAIMAGGVFTAGCSKKPKGTNEIVSADSVWYNMEKRVLERGFDPEILDYFHTESLGVAGDYLVLETLSMYRDLGPDMMSLRFVDYSADYIDIYDKSGELVNNFNLVEMMSDSAIVDDYIALVNETEAGNAESSDETEDVTDEEEAPEDDRERALSGFLTQGVCIVGDRIRVIVSFDGLTYDSRILYEALIDPATSEFTFERLDSGERTAGSDEGIVDLGDYQIEKIATHDRNYTYNSYVLNIYSGGSFLRSVNLKAIFPDVDILMIEVIMRLDDHTLLAKYYRAGSPSSFFTIDVLTGDVRTDDNGDYEWLNNYNIHDTTYFPSTGNVMIDDEGIQAIDYENKTFTEVFSFDSCNVNRGDIAGLKVVSYSEDEIVFIGTLFQGNMFQAINGAPQLIVLTRAESNPNAGKTILTAATVGYIDYAMSEAVCIFNETSPDYFITFDNRYKADNHIDAATTDYTDDESYARAYNEAAIELSNQLTVDLMAGDGPDIIFDTSSLSQLNSDDYLLDLSGRIDTEGMFTNVIDAASIGEKLYQIPLTFGVTGIAVLNENIGEGQTGFTFDQYASFVSTVCNGKNPLVMDQTEFFITCMDAMGDEFIGDDGRIRLDNEAFYALAEYTDDHVSAPIIVETGDPNMVEYGTGDPLLEDGARYMDSSSFDMYLALLGNHANYSTLLGLPSIDGRGPLLSVSSSVAISAQTSEPDACLTFVQTLLSPEVQDYYAQSSKGCPVNISSYESFARAMVDDYNRAVDDRSRYMTPAAMELYGDHITRLDYSVVDTYETMLRSCTTISTTDRAMSVIIREEMPAYFAGQKTLEEVISIMEDRIQTFLDERG